MKSRACVVTLTLVAANALGQGTFRPYEPLPLEPPMPIVQELPPQGPFGTVNFQTKVAGEVCAPVFDVDGITPLAGCGFKAQLYAGLMADSLAPVGSPVCFKTGLLAGYVNAGEVTLPWPGGTTVFIQMRCWTAPSETYEAAMAAPGGKWGESNVISVKLGTPPLETAPNLVGLRGLISIPEPSTAALALLGAAALLHGRRRHKTCASF